jgi:hypothetical protein
VTTPLVVLVALEPLVMIGMLAFTSRQVWRLEQSLRRDLEQGLHAMTGEYRQLANELRAAHREQMQAVGERFIAVEDSLAWVLPWMRYWVALHQWAAFHQQQAEEFPA